LLTGISAGCVIGSSTGDDLIRRLAPTSSRQLACEDYGIDGPPGRKCSYFAAGSSQEVLTILYNGLKGEHMATSCDGNSEDGYTITGTKKGMWVEAAVIPSGYVTVGDQGAEFDSPGWSGTRSDIPAGTVGLWIEADEYDSRSLYGGKACDDPSLFAQ